MFFGSIGGGTGFNVSGDIFGGFIFGGPENVSGWTVNYNVGGPVSVTIFTNPNGGQIMGGTIGFGPSLTRVGGSVTGSSTGVGPGCGPSGRKDPPFNPPFIMP